MRVSEEYAGVSHVGSMREISQDSPGLNRQTVAKRKRNRITLCNWGTIEKTLQLFFFIFFFHFFLLFFVLSKIVASSTGF